MALGGVPLGSHDLKQLVFQSPADTGIPVTTSMVDHLYVKEDLGGLFSTFHWHPMFQEHLQYNYGIYIYIFKHV